MKINPVAIVLILVSLSFASFHAGQAYHARKAYNQAKAELRDAQAKHTKKIQELNAEISARLENLHRKADRHMESRLGINPAKHQTFGDWKWYAGDHSQTNQDVLDSAWPGADGRWKRIKDQANP